jgi:hypothetical protein
MKAKKRFKFILFLFAAISTSHIYAHPTGNMITVGNNVLWSYINPINDTQHHACIMIWSKGTEPEIFVKSEFPSSDYMLYSLENEIYLIERRYIQATNKFEVRLLKTRIGENPIEIWSWFEDNWRIGEGGFFLLSDKQVIFGKYPNIYSLKKGENPTIYFDIDLSIKRIRAVGNNQILLLGENSRWLVKQNGQIIKKWNYLLNEQVDNAPLERNQIFDADYNNGKLLLAYWGKRSFEIVCSNGIQKTILQQHEPLTPHWVAFYGNDKLLFSSRLVLTGETPKPNLLLYNSNNEKLIIWKK